MGKVESTLEFIGKWIRWKVLRWEEPSPTTSTSTDFESVNKKKGSEAEMLLSPTIDSVTTLEKSEGYYTQTEATAASCTITAC